MRLLVLFTIGFFAVQISAKTLSTMEITKKFTSIVAPKNKVITSQSPIPSLYQIISGSEIFYASKDGKYIFGGGLHNFNGSLDNISDLTLKKHNLRQLELSDDLVTFKAKNEKYVVYAFTDPTCGYCMKLHYALSEYNKRGITVKYIPWPRGGEYLNNGMSNPTFEKFHVALCSSNKMKAIDDLFYKRRTQQNQKNCSADTLRNYIQVGNNIGVTATPAMIDSNGTFIPGFREPDELLHILKRVSPKGNN